MLQLEQALARPAPGRVELWAERVHDALIDLAATFERHIAVTEGDSGFLAEVREHSPRLINAIERLCVEHERIRDELSSTLTHVRRMPGHAGDDDVDALREHVTVLVTDLVATVSTAPTWCGKHMRWTSVGWSKPPRSRIGDRAHVPARRTAR